MPTLSRDNNAFGFAPKSQRGDLVTGFNTDVAASTTEATLFTFDTANFGGVSGSITIKNTGAASIRIRAYVSNDNGRSSGWITLANVYGEDDVSIALPLTITAGSVDHLVLYYGQQPAYTTFRYWKFTVDTAASTSTCDYYACGK